MIKFFQNSSKFKLIVCSVFLAGLLALLPHSIQRQESLGIDYPIFYKAANNNGSAEGYIYPPFFAWALYPLAQLPFHHSAYVWYVLNIFVSLWLIWKCLPSDFSFSRPINLLAKLVFIVASLRLVVLNAELGQVNCILLLLMLIAINQAKTSRMSGVSLGLAALIKVSPIMIIPYGLIGNFQKWKTALLYCISVILLGLILPWFFDYSFSGLINLNFVSKNVSDNLSLSEYLGRYSGVVGILLFIVTLFVSFRSKPRREVYLLPILLILIVSPIVRKAHLIFGLALGPLLVNSFNRLGWVPFVWAIGTLGTMVWSPAAILGNTTALLILLIELTQNPKEAVV